MKRKTRGKMTKCKSCEGIDVRKLNLLKRRSPMRTSTSVLCAAVLCLAVAGGCNKELQKSGAVPEEKKESALENAPTAGVEPVTRDLAGETDDPRPETNPQPLQSWDEDEGTSDTESKTDQSSGTDEEYEYEPAADEWESESESYDEETTTDETEGQDYDDYDYEYDE